MNKNPKTFSVTGNDFSIKMYALGGWNIDRFNEIGKKYRSELLDIVGAIGIGDTYVCGNRNGVYFNWLYTAPGPGSECVKIVSDRLIKAGFKKTNL